MPVKVITLRGRVPSKKNSKKVALVKTKTGKMRRYYVPNAQYDTWHTDASLQLKGQQRRLIQNVELILIQFYAPDRRSADNTNKAESIMDLMVDNHIIVDDNWFEVPKTHLEFLGVDKKNPRTIITIHYAE